MFMDQLTGAKCRQCILENVSTFIYTSAALSGPTDWILRYIKTNITFYIETMSWNFGYIYS